MAFTPYRELPDDVDIKTIVIANSTTLTIGDAILGNVTGHAKSAIGALNTTARILGVVISIVGSNSNGNTVTELNSVTSLSTNETTGLYSVQYIPTNVPMEYTADLTAVAGTTTDSDGSAVSFNMDTATNGKLLESGVALFAATTKQFVSNGVNPQNSSQIRGHWSAIARY